MKAKTANHVRIVREVSIENYQYQTWFSYPTPSDKKTIEAMKIQLNRIFSLSSLTDYKCLPEPDGIRIFLKNRTDQRLFYSSFNKNISDSSLKYFFTEGIGTCDVRSILSIVLKQGPKPPTK